MGIVLLSCAFVAAQDIKTNYMPGTDLGSGEAFQGLPSEAWQVREVSV